MTGQQTDPYYQPGYGSADWGTPYYGQASAPVYPYSQPGYTQPGYGVAPQGYGQLYGPPAVPPPIVINNITTQQTQQAQVAGYGYGYVARKSVGVAFLLTFLFGSLGLFYATVAGAIVMLCIELLFAIASGGLSLLVTRPICIIWGCVAASQYNSRITAVQYANNRSW